MMTVKYRNDRVGYFVRAMSCFVAIVALNACAILVHGQSATPPTTPPTAQSLPDGPDVSLELKAMRDRIEQLEAEVKMMRAHPQSPSPTLVNADMRISEPVAAQTSEAAVPTPTPAAPAAPQASVPFAFADWTWLNGNPRTITPAFDSAFFTPEIRADVHYVHDWNRPKDDTIGGSSELFRANEVQLEQIGLGGDFHLENVRARVMTLFGMFAVTTPRNDASPGRGQWDLRNAYRYLSEAYGGYHWDKMHGINADAGIFVSYIGLFSYYNFDNWAYQPSYVSSNTPWFFNGVRLQFFPTDKLKIEPWFINGWQSYGRFNGKPGIGGQINWRPKGWLNIISNNYGVGTDTLGNPKRTRLHTDDSIEVKYWDKPARILDKMAVSVTADLGCETGGGVNCHNSKGGLPKQSFVGYMAYNRFWFDKDKYAMTVGGGQINNPGRYLTLIPPINGADAISGTPYFTANPGDPFKAWDASLTFDYMPKQYITFRSEWGYRHANVPYFVGRGGITPSTGNTGTPGTIVPNFTPDLRKDEAKAVFAILVKF